MNTGDVLGLTDLSRQSGERESRLEEWREAGLIGSPSGGFIPNDVARARLVQICLERGVPLQRIVEAEREDHGFLDQYAALVFPGAHEPRYSLEEAGSMAGVEPRLIERIRDASQAWDPDEPFGDEEIELLRGVKLLLAAGVPEQAIIQGIRVTADALARVAENEGQLFHHHVHERLRAGGLAGAELAAATRAAAEKARPLLDPSILYFHRRGIARAARDDILLHLEEGLPATGVAGQLRSSILFTDLSSFTPLAETMGDETAAHVLDRFGHIVRDASKRSNGRIVKQIGDAFMIVFRDAHAAVACALDVERASQAEAQFPAVRSGIHHGEVLYRDGDYVGTVVNIASRLLNEAKPHQVLVTAAVRDTAWETHGPQYVPIGSRRLKGIVAPVELFAVSEANDAPIGKLQDPVCGMELATTEVAARLSLDGRERAFCSEACLRRFVASPAHYGATAGDQRSP